MCAHPNNVYMYENNLFLLEKIGFCDLSQTSNT